MKTENFEAKKAQIKVAEAVAARKDERAKKRLKRAGGLAALSLAVSYVLTGCGEGTSPISSDEFIPPKDPIINPEASPKPEAPTSEAVEETVIEEAAPTPTAEVVPTPTEIVPEYTLTPDFEDFQKSYIPPEELLNGDYWHWINDAIAPTLLPWFQEHEDKIKYIKPIVVGIPHAGSTFVFSRPGKIEYEDPETRPWKRDVTFASTSVKLENGNTLEYLVLPVFYYDKVTQQVYPIVSVVPIYNENPDYSEGKRQFLEVMNIPPIVYSQSTGGFSKDNVVMNDSIVDKSYAGLGPDEVWRRIQEFYDHGDMSVFSDPRIVVFTWLSSTDAFK